MEMNQHQGDSLNRICTHTGDESPVQQKVNHKKDVSTDDHFQEVSESNDKEPKSINFWQMFRFADRTDHFLMFIGSVGAIAMGASMPAFSYLSGDMLNAFGDDVDSVQQSKKIMLIFIYVGIGVFFSGWTMFACWMVTGERQAIACRKAYLRSLLRQEIGWFDTVNQTQLASTFATDTFAYQGAIGEKVSTFLMTISNIIVGLIFGFVKGWLMSLVLLACLPALAMAGFLLIYVIGKKYVKEQQMYSKAGGKAEQAISAVKTVKQLNGEDFQVKNFKQCLEKASQKSYRFALFTGIGMGILILIFFFTYGLGFWYGSRCVLGTQNCPQRISGKLYNAGDVIVVFFSVALGGIQLSQLIPSFRKIIQGKIAAARIFQIIDREPLVQNPPNGVKIENLRGVIRFENVTFRYPKDLSRKVFNNLTMEFDINKTGLVGESGCGKSTTLQLIMRFYDPEQGRVTVDGHDLRTLDLTWWRAQIGYVGQEPVLFATSIKNNLLFGKMDATDQDIEEALKMAEAWDFVQTLEDKLETYVGYGGGQLSGGQKQRIAIARAILRKPKIMLLDEATSALDRRNEKLIQDTLEKITEGMTTITVAHRVKTIMNSDIIYVFDKGGISEKGKFNQISRFKNSLIEKEDIKKLKVEKQKQKFQDVIEKPNEKQVTEKQQNLEKSKEIPFFRIFLRIFSYSKSKTPLFVIGIIAALIAGLPYPIFTIFLASDYSLLLVITQDPNDSDAIHKINMNSVAFVIIGIIGFIAITIQITTLTIVGESITKKLRVETYHKILKMPVQWFDLEKNNAGNLTTRLSTDCSTVNTITTVTFAVILQNMSTIIASIVISFVYQWRTALVSLALLPFMILNGAAQTTAQIGFSDKTDAIYKQSTSIIMEAVTNIRTVASFNYEEKIMEKYEQMLKGPEKQAIKKGSFSGLFFGGTQFILYIMYGLQFYLGAVFINSNPQEISVSDMFTAFLSMLLGGATVGNNSHFLSDISKGRNSALDIFDILDQQPEHSGGNKLEQANGDVKIEDIAFKYQQRKQYVFQHLNLQIKQGNKVAFVGPSGCGKSTVLQLLQRFYQPQKGRISLNDIDIKDFNLHYLRSRFGVVSQQPVLFNGTFEENIRYNMENVTLQDIRKAAQQANALSFIQGNQITLEKSEGVGFDKNVGVRGSHISGGQKQRVAIARTILRNPEILLLDQATSALDRQNEQIVQKSLDNLMKGRTVITVAHRMQTIKNCDEIFVFQKGEIVEMGNFQELMKNQKYFYKLQKGEVFV